MYFRVYTNMCIGPSGTVKLAKKEPVKKESVAKPTAAAEKKPAAAKVCYGPICPACLSRLISSCRKRQLPNLPLLRRRLLHQRRLPPKLLNLRKLLPPRKLPPPSLKRTLLASAKLPHLYVLVDPSGSPHY